MNTKPSLPSVSMHSPSSTAKSPGCVAQAVSAAWSVDGRRRRRSCQTCADRKTCGLAGQRGSPVTATRGRQCRGSRRPGVGRGMRPSTRRSAPRRVLPSGERVSPNLRTPSPARPCIQLSTVCDPACDSGYLSAALILFGGTHTFWRYPLRALFATRPKHPKPARTPASTPDPHHARSTTNPSNSLFYLVKLGTEGSCSHSRFVSK